MALSHRASRMATLIRDELARILLEEISDPSLREIALTRVALTGDLKQARIFFSPMEQAVTESREKEIRRGFARAVPFFKRRLGATLELRYVPSLQFETDAEGLSVQRVLRLIDETAKAGPAKIQSLDRE